MSRCAKVALLLVLCALTAVWTPSARALPSFARQTGQPCNSCHIGSLGPQLTPFGRLFKLNGYTLAAPDRHNVPLSAMVVASYTHTSADQPDDAGPHDGPNDNVSIQEASLFLAGRVSDHAGAFVQATYSDIDRLATLDNLDLRYARALTIRGHSHIFGVSLNNNPTVQDVWNTLPAWRFPYMASELVPESAAAPLIDGGLEHQVMGVTAYGLFNNRWYAELGGYRSLSHGLLDALNVEDAAGRISGIAPYWRFAYSHDVGDRSWSAGIFGLSADVHPQREAGPADRYRDVGIDGSYQFLGNGRHVFTANGAYVHEHQDLGATFGAGDAALPSHSLNSVSLNASYYYRGHYGLTLARFATRGSRDDALYAPEPGSGSRTGTPDSSGTILQADWTPFGQAKSWAAPWANLRLGLQYTWYDRFNGASRNYDGFGRDAKDNNTLFVFLWMAL